MGFKLSPTVFAQPIRKGEREKQLLVQKNISDQAKVSPTAFSKDLNEHLKDTLNELFHLETDYTQVKG